MLTARDLAKKLGVSISTVGRALTDDPRISAETKERVRRAADELGYVGSQPARMMRGGSSNLIGLLLPDVQNDFYASIAQALSVCCDRQGYQVVLSITGDDREAEARHVRDLVGSRVAGIIIVPTAAPRRECRAFLGLVPHVQLLRHVDSLGETWFGIDDEAALAEATTCLLEKGHKRIAYAGGWEKLSTGAARKRGVQRAFEEAGADLSDLQLFLGAPTIESGEAVVKESLASRDRPTAIISGSVHVTLGVLNAVSEEKILVPEELSIVGFGDPAWFAWWGPGLTTIRPPIQSLATTCGLWFLDQMRDRETGNSQAPHHSVSQSKLIERGSVATPG